MCQALHKPSVPSSHSLPLPFPSSLPPLLSLPALRVLHQERVGALIKHQLRAGQLTRAAASPHTLCSPLPPPLPSLQRKLSIFPEGRDVGSDLSHHGCRKGPSSSPHGAGHRELMTDWGSIWISSLGKKKCGSILPGYVWFFSLLVLGVGSEKR